MRTKFDDFHHSGIQTIYFSIFSSKYVCDGASDCTNGLDEQNCVNYANLYFERRGFKLVTDDKSITRISLEQCAKLCAQSKNCACSYFSYNSERQRCILGMKWWQ